MKSAATAIAFRLDASSQIGTGHFMRCLTLADNLKKHGALVCFVCRHMPEHLKDMLTAKGHEIKLLNSPPLKTIPDSLAHSSWLGTSQHADAQDTIKALSAQIWDWLIVDHYALDIRWESSLRQAANHIFVIDDIADREHDCDLLLDQNLYPNMDTRYTGKVPNKCKLFLGPHFALLRDEFLQLRTSMRVRDGSVQRILILLGGIDPENLTEKAILAVAHLPNRSLDIDVVIGAQHPERRALEAICKRYGYQCHVEISDVALLMVKADLAIGASGSTSWERCCLGLPTICLTYATNQVAIAEGLKERGAIMNLGDGSAISVADLSKALLTMIDQPNQMMTMSLVSSSLVDGKGANRVCEYLLEDSWK